MNPRPGGFRDYLILSKAGIAAFVGLTAAAGYILAGGSPGDVNFFLAVLGTAAVCAGAGVFNEVLERREDARMLRTRNRPLPARRMTVAEAVAAGVLGTLLGSLALARVSTAAMGLALAAWFLYLGVYTPLKKRTWWCNLPGAVAGALPPVIGWTAAAGRPNTGAWLLFTLLWLWQWPHLVALGWMFREDMARAGFATLPESPASQRRVHLALRAASLLSGFIGLTPYFLGWAGPGYLAAALALGGWFFYRTRQLTHPSRPLSARGLYGTSLTYLAAISLALLAAPVL